jgi:L-threonine kinase
VPPSPELYQSFPDAIRRTYREAVEVREPHGRHDLLVNLAEEAVTYLASLALSDYRSNTAPSPAVESLLDTRRSDRLTFGRALELFRMSAESRQGSLFPRTGPFAATSLPDVDRFCAGMDSIAAGVEGLAASASPSGINVEVYVSRALSTQPRTVSWWRAWDRLAEYRNHVAHASDHRWPVHNDHYYACVTPLLHDAVVAVLTFAPAADAILRHPIADITLMSELPDGTIVHTVCGEIRGLWMEHDIVSPEPITERWPSDDWHASDASKYVLEEEAPSVFSIRALYWDLQKSPPPPIALPLEPRAAAPEPRAVRRVIAPTRPLEGRGTAPGTCGEFVQGPLSDGTQFHVTCPINKSASVVVEIERAARYSVTGLFPHQQKLDIALRYTAELFELGAVKLRVRHWSDLDIGKGMGSSTADVLSGIRAVANAIGETLTPEQAGELATRVESSDGTMYPGIAVVSHKTGVKLRDWPWYPEFVIVMLVPRDCVDTEAIAFDGKQEVASEYESLLAGFEDAVAARSCADFAAHSTKAALLNAPYLVNPYAQTLAGRLDEFGALGLNVGHTGTVCGLLYPNTTEAQVQASQAVFELRYLFHELEDIKIVTTPRCPTSAQTSTRVSSEATVALPPGIARDDYLRTQKQRGS